MTLERIYSNGIYQLSVSLYYLKIVQDRTYGISDSSNGNGSMEFSIAGNPDDFFPVNVSKIIIISHSPALTFEKHLIMTIQIDFHSTKKSFINISIAGVVDSESNSPVKYSSESALLVDKYEIV